MTPPERYPPDDPREWLNRAKSNLAMAKNRAPDVYLEDLCFEAQQAAVFGPIFGLLHFWMINNAQHGKGDSKFQFESVGFVRNDATKRIPLPCLHSRGRLSNFRREDRVFRVAQI